MEMDYEYAEQSDTRATSLEEDEEKIYEMSYNDNENHGPIYTEPPTEVEKIYETFEGKRFRKLFHKNIK